MGKVLQFVAFLISRRSRLAASRCSFCSTKTMRRLHHNTAYSYIRGTFSTQLPGFVHGYKSLAKKFPNCYLVSVHLCCTAASY
jgi:hypothetical protein